MDNNFFANIEHEGDKIFTETVDETPSAELDKQEEIPEGSQPEKIEEEVIPYHKDPRWIKQRQELEYEKRQREELEYEKRQLEEQLAYASSGKVNQPQFLTDLVGENEEVARNFQDYEQELTQKILSNIQEQTARQERERQEFEQNNINWINNSLDDLSIDTGIQMRDSKGELTPTGKELLELISEYPVDDGRGNIDLKKGYSMLTKLKAQEDLLNSQKQSVRKDIADKTISQDNTAASPNKSYVSSNDIRNKGWYDL